MAPSMPIRAAAASAVLAALATAQQPGTMVQEQHPMIAFQECHDSGCETHQKGLTIDANWRWSNVNGRNCYTNQDTWDQSFCADGEACARQCSLEGANYAATYGISSSWNGVTLNFVTRTQYSSNFGSRLYLMEDESTYKMFKLKNREFTFTVDASQLTCGLNGALYFVEMDAKGDLSSNNRAGAKYGTGYCDAQCPHDIKWIKGSANSRNWNNTAKPPVGHYGACCAEMDIWEANSRATAFTPHSCSIQGSEKCEGKMCGDTVKGERYEGVCDKDGCDFNNYRMGQQNFYGKGPEFEVDTSKPVTVVTQFLTTDGTDNGDLKEIRRYFQQDGRTVPNSAATILGDNSPNSVSEDMCTKQKNIFGDLNDFGRKGGMKAMGEALDRGMVLVLSLWDDVQVNMLWLDSAYPTNVNKNVPGVERGPCPGGRLSEPDYLRSTVPHASVTFSDIKFGPLESTFENQHTGGHWRRMAEEDSETTDATPRFV